MDRMNRGTPLNSVDNRRKAKRKYLLFKIPVYDAQSRRFLGLVQDISETGLQLFGVKTEDESSKTLIIQASDYLKGSPLRFDAICRWTKRENPQGYHLSGYEITKITEEARSNLRLLMEYVTLG
jgi:hypothetical protein